MDHGFLVPVVRGQGGDRGGSFVCGRQRDGNFDLKKVHGFWKEVPKDVLQKNLPQALHPADNIATILDHEEHGATPLLGINGVIMKCHGSSTARGIKNSLIAAQKTVEENLIEDIAAVLSKHTDIFDDSTTISETNPV